MSKDVIINGTTYSGISSILVPILNGTATFVDSDEATGSSEPELVKTYNYQVGTSFQNNVFTQYKCGIYIVVQDFAPIIGTTNDKSGLMRGIMIYTENTVYGVTCGYRKDQMKLFCTGNIRSRTSPGIGNNALQDIPSNNLSGGVIEGHTVKIYELPLPDSFASIIDGWYTENAETESV